MTDDAGKPAAGMPGKAVLKFFSRLNVLVYRLTGGRVMGTLKGAPICLVTMTGRRSGRRLTTPLMYNTQGADVLLVASQGGAPRNPVWYYNIVADPHVVIQTGRTKRRMLAREVAGAEKAALWPVAVRNYPDFAAYRERTSRDIPVFLCSEEV